MEAQQVNKYPIYKPSGTDWIGDIPEHWVISKIKYKFKFTTGFTPPTGNNEYYNGIHIWITISDMNSKYLIDSGTKLSDEAIKTFKPEKTYQGSLLISFKLSVGKVAFAGSDLFTNEAIISIAPNQNYDLNFFYYTISQHLLNNAQENIYGAKLLNQELIKGASILFPPKGEQIAIAQFLDEKTARIDKLIDKKNKLIELLNEERDAVINQAVTRGIDPTVKLKPSGIDWLGEIPGHWEVKKLKYVGEIKYGLGQPPMLLDSGLPLIRATNIEKGKINENDLLFVDPNDVPYQRDPVLKENDIIVVRSGAYTGDSAIIPKKFDGAISGYDMVVRVKASNPKYISYCLLSNYVLINQIFLQRLRAAQPHLNKEQLRESLILLPGLAEQLIIVQHIENEIMRIDSSIYIIEQEILLLREYRTSLIAQLVTGKIKVI